jgi:hypothetical protein
MNQQQYQAIAVTTLRQAGYEPAPLGNWSACAETEVGPGLTAEVILEVNPPLERGGSQALRFYLTFRLDATLHSAEDCIATLATLRRVID